MTEESSGSGPVVALLTLSAVWDAELGAVLADLHLTTRKYGLLAHIQGAPGISFSELARRSLITVQSAHTAVKALQADGLVEDANAHAGSASDLRVTAAGVAALVEAGARVAQLDRAFHASAPAIAAALEQAEDETHG
ncbi:MarR family winged helix-turn-helix transcriptional regulator [Microbacterium gorillae]|uniref:MarR family winged helix-turn-helix transcriptional regulator n=1 Tax=Microbacterium gorillae TaxID=1231063 RepID=UPI000590C493|nr:helix-turn-helix domain-containing protein [Microbacterium gorillae]